MSKWTHTICRACWVKQHPEEGGEWKNTEDQQPLIEPVTLRNPEKELCCFCGSTTQDGIYIRHDPNELRCKGVHTV